MLIVTLFASRYWSNSLETFLRHLEAWSKYIYYISKLSRTITENTKRHVNSEAGKALLTIAEILN